VKKKARQERARRAAEARWAAHNADKAARAALERRGRADGAPRVAGDPAAVPAVGDPPTGEPRTIQRRLPVPGSTTPFEGSYLCPTCGRPSRHPEGAANCVFCRARRLWEQRAEEIRALGLTPEEVEQYDANRSAFLAARHRSDLG
jgi:DNA-directed RNA polymerase subunit RPC12/RpoP